MHQTSAQSGLVALAWVFAVAKGRGSRCGRTGGASVVGPAGLASRPLGKVRDGLSTTGDRVELNLDSG